jgi:hypothetical protein
MQEPKDSPAYAEFFLISSTMFRIVLYALWSKDYLSSLTKVIADAKGCGLEVARHELAGIGYRNPLEIIVSRSGKAYELCTNLLQFGGFVEIYQIGPVTDEGISEDFKHLLDADMRGWLVHVNGEGRVQRFVETNTQGQLRFEQDEVTHAVGLELLARGAETIDDNGMAVLKAAAEANRQERIAYAKEMTARYGPDWKHVLYLHRQYEMGYLTEPPASYPGLDQPVS